MQNFCVGVVAPPIVLSCSFGELLGIFPDTHGCLDNGVVYWVTCPLGRTVAISLWDQLRYKTWDRDHPLRRCALQEIVLTATAGEGRGCHCAPANGQRPGMLLDPIRAPTPARDGERLSKALVHGTAKFKLGSSQ